MATILDFQRTQRKSRPMDRPPMSSRGGEPGEVVLFPGIRYERWCDASPSDRRSNRFHDHLDLED